MQFSIIFGVGRERRFTPLFLALHQARSQVVRFGGAKYIFRGGNIFVFIICFNKQCSGHNIIWGAQIKFGGVLPPNAHRGYGPALHPCVYSMRSRNEQLAHKNVVNNLQRKTWNHETRSAHLIRAQENTRRISLGTNDKLTQTWPPYRKQSRVWKRPFVLRKGTFNINAVC